MKNKKPAVLTFALLSLTLLIGACSQTADVPADESLEALGFRIIPDVSDFPDIGFVDINGQAHKISEYRGSVVLLNFWASWCPPCRAEMPAMERMAAELAGGDFVMIPVNVQEPKDLVESFVKEFEIGFPVYLDVNADAAKEVGVTGLPTSILIDRTGKAVAVVTGAIEWDSPELIELMSGWTR